MLTVLLVAFIFLNVFYFNNKYEEDRHMQTIGTLEQVTYDLEGVPFWTQNKGMIFFSISIAILLILGITILHLADSKVKCVVKEVDTPGLIQALIKKGV